MNYQSPIEVIQTQMRHQIEGEIYKAVMNVGVNVDREELLKALAYDRNQYQKGYADRDAEIVRCMDCKYRSYYCTEATDGTALYNCHHPCANSVPRPGNWFCADGKKEGR